MVRQGIRAVQEVEIVAVAGALGVNDIHEAIVGWIHEIRGEVQVLSFVEDQVLRWKTVGFDDGQYRFSDLRFFVQVDEVISRSDLNEVIFHVLELILGKHRTSYDP